MTSIKRAEEDEDLIIRLFEPTGTHRRTTLAIPALRMRHRVELRGHEVRTLRINTETGKVTETDLLERPLPRRTVDRQR